MDQPTPPAPPAFNPDAPHQQRPKLRAVRGFPAQHGEQTLMGLADARQISPKVVFTVPQVQLLLPLMDGKNDLDGIVAKVGRGLRRQDLEMLVAQLDDAGLLEGPTFDAILARVRAEFDSALNLPPSGTADFADALVVQELGDKATPEQKNELGPTKLREILDQWMGKALEQAADPSFNSLPRAIVAPHLDYARGWLNYASVYGRMRVVDRPDRIIILGTNHFGHATGVCGCDKGFESPLGVSDLDKAFVEKLGKNLGDENTRRLFEHRYDHEREHSIELHMPWVHHVFGENDQGKGVPVFAALVHDPSPANGESYDGRGLGLLPFVDALRTAIEQSPGRTLLIASADLSHVGQSFGDKTPIVGESEEATSFRNKVLNHDREMLALIGEGKAEELVASMAWQQNPTRWCSVGNLVAMLKVTGARRVQMLQYALSGDQQGVAMVSSFAGAVV